MSEKRTLVSFDWAIKNILRDKANYDVLEGFLSTLLEKDITILSLLESESNQQYETDKFNRVDLVVEDELGEVFIIEVQNDREIHYLERLLYGSSKVIVDHLKLGDSYADVKKVIMINILYFLLGEGETDYIYYGKTEFHGLNDHQKLEFHRRKRDAVLGNGFKSHRNIFPEYYLIEVERFQDHIQKGIDEWIYFFKNSEIRPEFKSKNIQKAREKLDLLKMSDEHRKAYERYLINRMSEKEAIDTAKLDGREEGREEGIEIGIEKGRVEEKTELAINMLRTGKYPHEEIAELTGLSLDQIKALTQDGNLDTRE